MLIKRVAMGGADVEMEIDVTQEQLDRWNGGELINVAMPHLPPPEREFLMTGTTPKMWMEWFGAECTSLECTPQGHCRYSHPWDYPDDQKEEP